MYDETYRKAGKLDSDDFLIVFDASRSSLVDVIRTELLVESPQIVKSEDLSIELYKLNVYGASIHAVYSLPLFLKRQPRSRQRRVLQAPRRYTPK